MRRRHRPPVPPRRSAWPADDIADHRAGLGAEHHPHADLARALGDDRRGDGVEADGCEQQAEHAERREQQRAEARGADGGIEAVFMVRISLMASSASRPAITWRTWGTTPCGSPWVRRRRYVSCQKAWRNGW
jgi:hypothetical protein